MAGKLGVYICTGCGIGEAVDGEKLAKVATSECKAASCRTHPALCGAEGCAQIRQDLAGGAVDTVVVAACSPRFKTEAFSLNHGTVVERVNLREHVAWCHAPQDENTQMLAEDYLRMGVARARKTEPLEPLADEISRALLVIGGGVTGITAALEAAAAGYSVFLVEKEENLGGAAARCKRQTPAEPPYTAVNGDGLTARMEAVLSTTPASRCSVRRGSSGSKASRACSMSRCRSRLGSTRFAPGPSWWRPAGNHTMFPAWFTWGTASART